METTLSARELLERGRRLIAEGRSADALEPLRRAHALAPDDATCRSAYGLCLGRVEGPFDEALALCSEAAKQEFFNPELYLNLARLHLEFGFKPEGVRYLRRGQMIDPGNESIAAAIVELGLRRSPVLSFLPRRHLLNRWLGGARHLFARRQRAVA